MLYLGGLQFMGAIWGPVGSVRAKAGGWQLIDAVKISRKIWSTTAAR